jgi:TonB family protein
VYNAITQKAICIRKDADEDEAQRLSAQFGAIGAEVVLEPVGQAPAAAAAAFAAAPAGVAAAPAAAAASNTSTAVRRDDDDDEDEDDEPGRILTDEEYAEIARSRPDLFHVEKASKMRNIQVICIIMATLGCAFLSTRTVIEVATDFFERLPEERMATLRQDVERPEEKKKEEEKKEEVQSDRKQLRPQKSQGLSASSAGGGDPRQRVTQMGVLGIVSGQIKGRSVQDADVFGKGGFASDIDAILTGMSGLVGGGDGGIGRQGPTGIGFGPGFGPGFGGGGGIAGLLDGFGGGSGGGNLDLKRRGTPLQISSPGLETGRSITGGRSRASVQRVVMQNMAALRHAYNRRLREKPGLAGRITVKFSIDEFGKVLFAQVVESTMNDPELENTVVTRIRSWVFETIDKPGDVTEVTYPFVFSQ